MFGVTLVCAHVALVPLVFDYAADWPFTVPKALLSHSLAYVLAAVMIGMFVRFGRDAFVWSWLHVPIVAFVVVNVAAAVFAEDRFLALYGTHARMLGLGTIAAWTVLYFGIVTFIRSRRDVVALVVACLGSVTIMLTYEVVQLLGRDPFRWTTDTSVRPFSTNGQATSLASYFTALAVAIFGGGLAVREVPRWTRGVLFLFSAALLAGAAATGTRSAVIGLVTGSAVLVALVWFKHPSPRARWIGGAAALATAAGLALLLTVTPIGGRLLQTGPAIGESEEDNLARLDLASLDVRAVLYEVAADVVRERPLLGYGPDNFVVGMTRFRPEQGPDEARLAYATSAHSWVGQIASGSGITGLAVYVGIIGGVAVLSARSGFQAVPIASASGLAAHLGTGLTSVTDVGSDWLFWVAAALMAGSYAAASRAPEQTTLGGSRPTTTRHGSGMRAGVVLTAVLIAVGIGLAVTSLRAIEASRSARLSQDSRLVGRITQAVDAARSATTADPGRAEYWQRLGLAYVAGARWRDAADALERAVAAAPWDVRYSSDLVATQLILARDGDARARVRAVALAESVVLQDPNYPAAHYTRALVMQLTGNVQEGLRSIERALALSPQSRNAQWYVVATQLYLAAGRTADAIRAAETGFGLTASRQVRIELARALLADGRSQDALVQIDAVLAVESGNAAAQRLRAEILNAIPK